jgi:colanic acid biosynthesis glycosyl transferase WcaI
MRILLLSLFYTPEPVARPHELALALCQAGHQVSVLTAFPNYPQGKLYPPYRLRFWQWERLDGLRILRVPHLLDRSRSAGRRLASYLSFSLVSVFLAFLKIPRPDVLWTYQIGLPGALLSKLWGVPLVHEVQDLWPDWGQAAGLGLKGWLYRLLERQEKWVYRRAQALVTITAGFKQELVAKGADPARIEIIPNWANEAIFHPASPDAAFAREQGFTGFFNLVYIGNVGAAQALGVLLEAADLLRDSGAIRFVIIGDGVERAGLEKRARSMGLKNIRFLGSRPQAEVANYMALADVLFLHLKRDRVYQVTIPSKTYGYLASGRPILAAAQGELAGLILDHGAGLVCPPEDAPALAHAVRQLAAMTAAERNALGQAGYQVVTTIYSRNVQGKRYNRLFENIFLGNQKRVKNV